MTPPLPATLPAELSALLAALQALTAPTPVPLSRWRDEVTAATQPKSRNTRIRMAQALREAIHLAGGDDATTLALTPELVNRFAARGGRASTTNGLLASLRVAVKLAAARRYVPPSLAADCCWRVLDREPTRVKHHGRAEVARVLRSLEADSRSWDGHRLYALASVLAYAGLRRNEALRLKVADVDLKRGFVFVRPHGRPLKSASSAAPVPLPRALAAVLGAWLPRCGSEWVFPTKDRQRPWTGGSAGYRPGCRLKAAGAAVGVPGFTPHSLRHSLATHLAGYWGLSTKQVQMVLRHSAPTTQRYYVHADLVNLGRMVRGFEYGSAGKVCPRPGRRGHGFFSRFRAGRLRESRL